jgi:uncharacterized protein (TIGR03437 family)
VLICDQEQESAMWSKQTLMVLCAAAALAQQSFIPNVLATVGTPSKLLYGSYHGVLLRSIDNGSTWTPMYVTEPGLPQPPILKFQVDSSNSNILYLGTTQAAGGFWRSNDSGITWVQATAGLPTGKGAVDYFKQVSTPSVLFAKIANQLFRSTDNGNTWSLQGNLPGSDPTMDISDSTGNRMYYINRSTLSVYSSGDSGHSWTQTGAPPAPVFQTFTADGIGLLFGVPTDVLVSVAGLGAFLSTDGGSTFTDQTATGLGEFSTILSGSTGPIYAIAAGTPGFYRSIDNGQSWKGIGLTGISLYTLSAVDPGVRTSIYGIRGGAVAAFIHSADAGDTWTPISATTTPTLAKPVALINVTLEQGAPYSQSFSVQAFEDSTWAMPVTLSTSGETWLQLGSTSGTTPLANTVTFATAGLAPGTYQSSITITAPQSFNKSVTVPVQLTIRPLGSLGPQYTVTTVAGNGNSGEMSTGGKATNLAIGAAKALAVDGSGRLLISAGNRIWQLSGSNATLLAGNGTFGSTGDGSDPTQAMIGDPDAIAFDLQGTVYFTEYIPEHVRKIFSNAINTSLDLTRFGYQVGSHSLLIDSTGRFLVTNPSGLLRYDGLRVVPVTSYPFSDPYGLVSDANGNFYVSDRGSNQIFFITPNGAVSVFAGTGIQGLGGDGGPATLALLNAPAGLALDGQGNLYFADSGNQRIRAIGPDGNIRTVAGSGLSGFAGDGATADFASFNKPLGIALDQQGNLYVADAGNNRVRELSLQSVPKPQPTSLLNAASGDPRLSPGSLFSVYGTLLGPLTPLLESGTPWPRSLAGVSVIINGITAPLYYVSATQINGQIPYETALGTATAIVTVGGSAPAQLTFPVIAANPGILVYNTANQATAVNPDGSVNAPNKPAAPGDIEVLYLTGIGIPDHPVATGAASPSVEPLARVQYPYTITINGQNVQVYYLGMAPGYPALVQANLLIPTLPAGDYPLVVTVNGVASNAAVISIR